MNLSLMNEFKKVVEALKAKDKDFYVMNNNQEIEFIGYEEECKTYLINSFYETWNVAEAVKNYIDEEQLLADMTKYTGEYVLEDLDYLLKNLGDFEEDDLMPILRELKGYLD